MKYALSSHHSLLFADLSLIGTSSSYFKRAMGINYTFLNCLIREPDLFWNYDNDIFYNRALLKERTLNQGVKKFINSLERAANHLEETTEKIIGQQVQETDSYLHSVFISYTDAYLLLMPFLFHFWQTENLLMTQLKLDFAFMFGEDAKEKTLQKLLVPSRPNYFSLEKENIEKIALLLFKKPKSSVEPLIEDHIKKFSFSSFVNHIGKPLDRKMIQERLHELLKEDRNKKFLEKKKLQKLEIKERQHLFKQLIAFPEIYERVLLAQQLLFWRHQRLDVFSKSDFTIKPIFEMIATKMGLSYQEFVYLRYQEIINWFTTKKFLQKQTIHQRIKSYCFLLENGKVSLLTKKSLYPKIKKNPLIKVSRSNNVVQGMPAYQGKIIGKVKIIRSVEDIKTLQTGEILVTSMTRPDMTIGLEKAAAFVTDQGGMLSHAAIVSREMKKPCIVGTKNATELLKNGMVVEVNATKGIVKIIS